LEKYNIVDCGASDKNFILNLNKKNLPAVSVLDDDLFNMFLKYSEYFKIIKIEDTPVGFLIALLPGNPYESINYKWFENRYKSFIYVDRIVISSDHQDKGIGSFFYDHIKLSFHDRLNSMVCEVNLIPKNAQSINFHKKYGFTEVGQQYTDQRKKLVSMQLLSF
tara:strand:- start:197 stop:688 length:492 start_codon:yes stop_codon:yes gene_type:complete